MPYLNNLKLNSNNYAIGTKIKKLNLNGSIYDLGLDTSDANLPASSVVESYHGYAQGNHIYGSIPKRSEVGYNGVIGINDSYPNVAVLISNDTQYNLCTNGQYIYCIKVPEGYYNGWTYIGSNYTKLCADGNDTWIGLWGSQADLIMYACSISAKESDDPNYMQHIAPYSHRRGFRLIVSVSDICQVSVTKNYNSYKQFTTNTNYSKNPTLDITWEDVINPYDSFRVHIGNSDGAIGGYGILQSYVI